MCYLKLLLEEIMLLQKIAANNKNSVCHSLIFLNTLLNFLK